MIWNTCVIDSSATDACIKARLVKDVSEDDENYVNAKRGISSYVHCMRAKFTKVEAENLGYALHLQYLLWAAIHFFITLTLVFVSQSDAALKAVSSTLGLIILNGMALAGIAVLAVKRRFKVLRYVCEWYAFCSQVLLAFASETSPSFASVIKCAALLSMLSFALFFISYSDHIPTAGVFACFFAVFGSVTLVFVLHMILPYESAFGMYMAVMYSLGWCAYMIHESFQWVLVMEV
ncbi:hypothetical protein IWW39_002047 [Coemansia spiralis]|uniref:Uncharacterized protein n=1 Tax=Coemansia spiralis TaxID=417178 RepID=A0A9W8L3Y2_9FUNG|nr:hypothetical protein IWW39_002047 [Coemansia spiralis]